jgi:hypothetical protein
MPSGATSHGGKLIVLTAPLTETIEHAGYFIQMALASLPKPPIRSIDVVSIGFQSW